MSLGPNIDVVLSSWWGNYAESTWLAGWIAGASGILVGTNPPYSVVDLLSIYPIFTGKAIPLNPITTVEGNPQITVVVNTSELAIGYLVTGPGVAPGSTIVSIDDSTHITLSAEALTSGSGQGAYYPSPLVPIPLINLYIALASASLYQGRWGSTWYLGMALYVAHFCTMWLRSYVDPNSNPTATQVAQAGIEKGMLVAKSVGDVSGSYQNMMQNYLDWGAFAETTYGAQLITFARTIGMGMMYAI